MTHRDRIKRLLSQNFDKPSGRWFWASMVSSVFVVLVAQLLMLSLYWADVPSSSGVAIAKGGGPPLIVAVGRTPGGPSEWITYARVLSRLQKDLGRPLELRYLPARSEAVNMLASKKADLAFVSTFRYLDAHRKGIGKLVAAPRIEHQPKDAAVIVVSSASDISSVKQLKGRSMLLADPYSLGGCSFMYWEMDHDGIDPRAHFSTISAGGSQEANLHQVIRGVADAATVNRSALARWPEGKFRIISESPEYGMPPLIARSDLDAALVAEVQTVLVGLNEDVGPLEGSHVDGFTIPEDADYGFARVLLEYTEQLESCGRLVRGENQ